MTPLQVERLNAVVNRLIAQGPSYRLREDGPADRTSAQCRYNGPEGRACLIGLMYREVMGKDVPVYCEGKAISAAQFDDVRDRIANYYGVPQIKLSDLQITHDRSVWTSRDDEHWHELFRAAITAELPGVELTS